MTYGVQTSERVRATLDLARQLASAVASYRLFPGDLQQDAYVAAVGRVQAAAERATAGGPAGIEIRSGVVTIEGETFPDDGNLGRFARDCFDRRVEHVTVTGIPTGEAIAAVGDALSEPVEQSLEEGGPQRHLDQRGVTSISLDAVAPRAQDVLATRLASLTEEQRELWQRLSNPEGLAASLIVEGLDGDDPAGAAESVYRRFEVLFQSLPVDLVGRGDVFAKMRTTLEALPPTIRREFLARVISRAHRDQFAGTFVNDMTDADLVTALLDLSQSGGPDAIDLAKRIVASTGRSNTVVEMLEARLGHADEAESEVVEREVSAPMAALSRADEETQVRSAIADALGEGLLDATHHDARTVREEWPVDEGALAALTYDALRDYLAAERDLDRLDAVLQRWVLLSREAMRDGDELRLEGLLELLDHPRSLAASAPGDKAARLGAAVDGVLTPELIGELVDAAQDETRSHRVEAMLRRFHGEAVAAVLDRLASEQDRGVRSQLVRIAGDLATEDLDEFGSRLDDPRWYVVRNLVTILGRAGTPEVVPMLVQVLGHGEPAVRRETLRALVASAGGDAVPYVRRLASDRDPSVRAAAVAALAGLRVPTAARALADIVTSGGHQDERQAAITALRDHPADEATTLLETIVKAKGNAKLPRSLRKTAKTALKARRSA